MNSTLKCVCFLRMFSKYSRLHGGPIINSRHIVRHIMSTSQVWKSDSSKKSRDTDQSDDGLNPELKAAAKSVADSMKGESAKAESDILQQLKSHAKNNVNQKDGPESVNLNMKPNQTMSDILSQMRVQKQGPEKTRSEERKTSGKGPEQKRVPKDYTSIGDNYRLFDGPSLGIFTVSKEKSKKEKLVQAEISLFDEVEREEFEKYSSAPPRNAFEEMIQWTKEGKLWTFPIDNEAGMVEEKNVEFHEHIFLDHLISDFPKKGPIRHFMELVTTGLSKNPYLTVQQKKEHIQWFRDYFKEKQPILEETLGSEGIISERKKEAKQ